MGLVGGVTKSRARAKQQFKPRESWAGAGATNSRRTQSSQHHRAHACPSLEQGSLQECWRWTQGLHRHGPKRTHTVRNTLAQAGQHNEHAHAHAHSVSCFTSSHAQGRITAEAMIARKEGTQALQQVLSFHLERKQMHPKQTTYEK
jgi:hypothetical protein